MVALIHVKADKHKCIEPIRVIDAFESCVARLGISDLWINSLLRAVFVQPTHVGSRFSIESIWIRRHRYYLCFIVPTIRGTEETVAKRRCVAERSNAATICRTPNRPQRKRDSRMQVAQERGVGATEIR